MLRQLLAAHTQQDMAACGELYELCDMELPNWGMSAESDIVPEEVALVMQQACPLRRLSLLTSAASVLAAIVCDTLPIPVPPAALVQTTSTCPALPCLALALCTCTR